MNFHRLRCDAEGARPGRAPRGRDHHHPLVEMPQNLAFTFAGPVHPQAVAMKIPGHRTASVFTRYNIVSSDDMRDAMQRIEEYRGSLESDQKVAPFPSNKSHR